MATVTFTTRGNLVAGNVENIDDVTNCLDKLLTGVNNVEAANIVDATLTASELGTTLAEYVGVTAGGTTRRGASVVATQVDITGTTYATDAGDTSITVTQPTNGLTLIYAQCDMKNTAVGTGTVLTGVQIDGGTNRDLVAGSGTSFVTYASVPGSTSGTTADAGTGWPAPVAIYSAGTHSYRLIYKVTTGTGSFKNRKLFVWTIGF